MPVTPRSSVHTTVRIESDLLGTARQVLGMPDNAPLSQVIRAALRRLTDPQANGEPANRGGRPRKNPVEKIPAK